ncbi:MAG: hypothetical protein AB7T63_13250 [Planctomycetota bacterium]
MVRLAPVARHRWLVVAGVFALVAAGVRPLRADDPPAPSAPAPAPPAEAPASPEVWRVERDGAVMELPVGNLSEPVREVLRMRLTQQGWKLLGPDTPAPPSPPPTAVPPTPSVIRVPTPRDPIPAEPPSTLPPRKPAPLRFAGAALLSPEGDGAGWQVGSVPTTSLAYALGLRFGDRLLAVNGAATRDALVAGVSGLRRGSQLTLLVARREGGVDTIEVEPLAPSASEPRARRRARAPREADPQESSR